MAEIESEKGLGRFTHDRNLLCCIHSTENEVVKNTTIIKINV